MDELLKDINKAVHAGALDADNAGQYRQQYKALLKEAEIPFSNN
jgi:hypothetical protein